MYVRTYTFILLLYCCSCFFSTKGLAAIFNASFYSYLFFPFFSFRISSYCCGHSCCTPFVHSFLLSLNLFFFFISFFLFIPFLFFMWRFLILTSSIAAIVSICEQDKQARRGGIMMKSGN